MTLDSPDQMRIAAAQAEMAAKMKASPALRFPDRTFTHDQVRRLGAAFATRMVASGIGPEARVCVASHDTTVVLAAMLGAARIGAAVVQIAKGAEPPAGLTVTHTLFADGEDVTVRGKPVIVGPDWSPAANPETEVAETDPDAPWLYVHTSGTTGMPKFVALSQRMVVERSRAVADDFPRGGKAVLLYPAGTRPWMARAFALLLNGGTLCSEFAPADWLDEQIGLVSGSRAQFDAVLASPLPRRLARAEVIGAKLPESEAKALLGHFETVDDTYGSSETSKCYSTIWTRGPDGALRAVGKHRDSAIELVDAASLPVPTGSDGIVRIKNKYMAAGYVGDDGASREAFRDMWFYPGDVGHEGEAGRIQFRNRMDHVVNIRGEKVNAYAIDLVFRASRGIRDAIVFRNPKPGAADELFAFVVFEAQANRIQAIESAKYAIRERFGEAMVPRVIRPVAGIPRKDDGTPDRKACADLILSIASG